MKRSQKKITTFALFKSSLIFALIGLIIPALGAIVLLEIQELLTYFGIECPHAWVRIWKISRILALTIPILFSFFVLRQKSIGLARFHWQMVAFNLCQYILLQAYFVSFFTSGQTLCFSRDGQNGLEFVFCAWLALPILLVYSFILSFSAKRKQVVLNA